MANTNLEDLFKRLKAPPDQTQPQSSSQPSIWAEPQPKQQPSAPSPIFSSSARAPAPSEQSRTNNLLNLLKTSQGGQSGPMANLQNVGRTGSMQLPSGHGRENLESRPLSAQDLVASLQRQPSAPTLSRSPMTAAGAEKPEYMTSQSASKDFLLGLLKKPSSNTPANTTAGQVGSTKSSKLDSEQVSLDRLAQSFAGSSITPVEPSRTQRESTPVRQFGSPVVDQTTFEAPQPTKASMFDYVNPFEQLHSSSPLNRGPLKPEAQAEPKKYEILKHDRDVSSALNGDAVAPAPKRGKLTSQEISPILSPAPKAEAEKGQSVSKALEDVGEQVDKQVEQALNEADAQMKSQATSKAPAVATGDNAADDGMQIKQEPAEDEGVGSSWESAEDEEAQKEDEDYNVEVYNFPMKPFVSIQVKDIPTPRAIRQDHFMFIAQLKKEFDQIDRSLVTASQTHIVYAQVATKKDNGGFRIILQDTGRHKQVFRSSGERIFNVQLCNSVVPGSDIETVLGTGVNGSIFWTSLAKSRGDLFADDDVEAQGFIMPAVATPEEQTSGSLVKTRAKMSSRHPEFFGVSRSKHIHIIAPDTVKGQEYCDTKTRKVNSEKYLAEHALRIFTGKAGKDFCFSEDDTMIVSLDKSGRVKFWDIKELTSRAANISEDKHDPVELKEPIWSLSAAASGSKPDEKPSVSSIMFLDKERPTMKGVALRYVLIGFKQNHILQLWDLGLGKAVQELRLPHEKDSDGICSITYHPRSGIIALGHPTRNSIFFIHVSAPKYALSNMDQAKYINLLARGDPALPRPDSTAIMSGLREFSFAKVGQLRSIEMLRTPVEPTTPVTDMDATLFELYVMHSKGVVGIAIKRQDLGWDKDSKMTKPVDGLQAGVVEVKELVAAQSLSTSSEISSNAETVTPSKQTMKKHETAKPSGSAAPKSETIKREKRPSPPPAPPANGAPRSTTPEQGSMQIPEAPLPSQGQQATNPPIITPDSYAMIAQRSRSPARDKAVQDAAHAVKNVVSPSRSSDVITPQVSSNDDLAVMLNKHFDALYQRIDGDKRVVDAAGSARQDAMLRLVSSTLTENVEKSLNRIISSSIEKEVIPAITSNVNKTVEKQLLDTLPKHIDTNISREIKATLPPAIQAALKDPQVQRTISDQITTKVQQQVSQLLQQSMPNIATQATQKMIADLDARTKQQMRELETRRVHDNTKIHELTEQVRSMSEALRNMTEAQVTFQEQMLKLQQERPVATTEAEAEVAETGQSSATTDPQVQAQNEEVARITQFLIDGEFDQATYAWLQSARQAELFELIFIRVNPRYLERTTPLLMLSVSMAITSSFETSVEQRLEWLQIVLDSIDLNNEEVKDVSPRIMDVLGQRLQGAYMSVSEKDPADPSLRKMSSLHRQSAEVRRLVG